MKIKKIWICVIVILLIGLMSGCSQKVSESDVKFANGKVENMLIALNNDDYNKFTENFSTNSKKAFTKDDMDKQNKIITKKVGNYLENSKKFKEAAEVSQNGKKFIVVIYDVKYKNEPGETLATAAFDDDNKHAVESINISSPKLRKN
ncbi:DUF3887 domain-containing protein [Clostridium akagii]|uniref:DUF3887 domain-containing protein n=1 Tax=Clostridium akagii TaxID=91623 RepID=UPI00047B1729|nr:DUF3887 domain-containing protein [Clostridium akagii]